MACARPFASPRTSPPAYLKPWVHGWWEFGKSSASFADLNVDIAAPRLTRLRATQATPRPVTSARSVSPKMKKAAVANTL